MIINLKNKTAWVGGGTSGLGNAIAHQLAKSGATVIIVWRNEERLKQTVASLATPYQQKHQYLQVDFGNLDSFKNTVNLFFEKYAVDIMVNNTSGPPSGNVLSKTEDDYQAAFNQLFQTVQYSTSKALSYMQQNRYGRIINLTSRTVKEPVENLALSNTIRAAITTWGKTLANAVAQDNITVNNILTGNFDTERLRQLFNTTAKDKGISIDEVYTQSEQSIPMKRLGKPEELATIVTFLASEQASYITGINIAVDGGLLKSL